MLRVHRRKAVVVGCFELTTYRIIGSEKPLHAKPILGPLPHLPLFASLLDLRRYADKHLKKHEVIGQEHGHKTAQEWMTRKLMRNSSLPENERVFVGYTWKRVNVLFFPDRKGTGYRLPDKSEEVRVRFPVKRKHRAPTR